jgi:hypothetical protein
LYWWQLFPYNRGNYDHDNYDSYYNYYKHYDYHSHYDYYQHYNLYDHDHTCRLWDML